MDEDIPAEVFFRYQGVVGNKNLPKSVKNQDTELQAFVVKENNTENEAD